MKELVIISGKGGTGKTSLSASFATLAQKAVLADCDVDAADLHILLNPQIQEREEFRSGVTAEIDPERCTGCGKCREVCRFDAISEKFIVNGFACEGCEVCFHLCPANAISTHENVSGECYISGTKYGPMVHARLGVAEENSGKLVARVRQQAKRVAEEQKKELILIDGPPGIGCPVISSIAGTNLVLVVTEPTLSGMHDLQRVAELTAHFQVPTCVCVNKFDLNPQMTEEIENYCSQHSLSVVGKIPYDSIFVKALVQKLPLVRYSQGVTSETVIRIWQELERYLTEG